MTDGGYTVAPLGDVDGQLWRSFLGASSLLAQRLSHELAQAHGLTLGEFGVLAQLSAQPDRRMRMAALADSLCFTRSRTTQIMDRLERARYATRDKSDTDGRGVFAVLTETGLALVHQSTPLHAEATRHFFLRHFEDHDVHALTSALERVITDLRRSSNGRRS